MAISALSAGSSVTPLAQFLHTPAATGNGALPNSNHIPNASFAGTIAGSVQPPSGSAAASGTGVTPSTGPSSAGQAGSVSQQINSLGSYMLGLQQNVISDATNGVTAVVTSTTSAMAASQYAAASTSASNIVANSMIC
jgi:hypothetical protein